MTDRKERTMNNMMRYLVGLLCALALPSLAQAGDTSDFLIEVARGNIEGHHLVNKFGENTDIDSGFETLWDAGGIYVAPTQARLHDVASTLAGDAGTTVSSGTATGGSLTRLIDTIGTFETDSVAAGDLVLNDTNVEIGVVTSIESEFSLTISGGMKNPETLLMFGEAGIYAETSEPFESGDAYRIVRDASTGVSVMWVLGLDASNLRQQEFVVTNGQTDVETANTYTQQHRARVFASAAANAAGTITSTADTDGTVTIQVENGNNQSLMAVYTVAENQTGYLMDWWALLSGKVNTVSAIRLKIGTLGGIQYIAQTGVILQVGDSTLHHDYHIPVAISGGSSVEIQADSSLTDAHIAGGFSLLLVDNGF